MAAALIGSSAQTLSNGGNPAHTHTAPAGSNRVLVALVTHEDDSGTDITGITYGTVAGTNEIEVAADTGGLVNVAELWSWNEAEIAAAGSNAFVITFGSGNPSEGTAITTRFAQGVTQAGPSATASDSDLSNNGSGLTPSLNETADGVAFYAGFHGGSAAVNSGPTGYTEIDNDQDTGGEGHTHTSYSKLPVSSGTTAPTVTYANAHRVGLVAAVWDATVTQSQSINRSVIGLSMMNRGGIN
jgi:hypothetical protein